MKQTAIFAAILLVLPFCAFAMPPGPHHGPDGKEELMDTIGLLMIQKMKEHLELSNDQTVTLMDIHDEKMKKLAAEKEDGKETMEELKRLVEDPNTSDGEFKAIVAELEDHRDAMEQIEKNSREEMRNVLTPRQQAEFVIFMHRFQKQIKKRIHGKMQERRFGEDGGGDMQRKRLRDPELH